MSSEVDAKPSARKRRWWQFSIKSLLVLMLLAAICVGWWTDRQHLFRQAQQSADEAARQRAIAQSKYLDVKMNTERIKMQMAGETLMLRQQLESTRTELTRFLEMHEVQQLREAACDSP